MIMRDRPSLDEITPGMYADARNYYDHVQSQDYIPVVIPVRNGAAMLGATLLALSKSQEPTLPLIINNRSTDSTPDIAHSFGLNCIDQNEGSKVAALQTGLSYAAKTLLKREVLVTDADALYSATTSSIMRSRLNQANPDVGMGLLGSSVFSGGSSRTADNLYTTLRFVKDASRMAIGKNISARGHNYGIAFDSNGAILSAIEELDKSLFVGDAHAVMDAIARAGGLIETIYSPATIVNVQADRVGGVKDVFEKVFSKETELKSYRQQYGEDFTIYDRKS